MQANICPLSPDGKTGVDGFVVVGALVVVVFVVVCALVVVGFMLVGSVLLGFVEAFASVETALSLVPSWLEGVDETSVVPSACVCVRLSKAFASCMVVLLE